MNKYKIITCDLDGTLIGSNQKISEENITAIKELEKKGVYFVPSSGRVLSEMKFIADKPFVRYVIWSSGAVVLDKKTGEKIDFQIPLNLNNGLFEILNKYDVYNIAHIDGECYIDHCLSGKEAEYNIPLEMFDVITSLGICLENFKENILCKKLECVCTFFKNKEDRKKCYEELSADGNFKIAKPWPYDLDIFYKTAGKGNAVKALAEKLGTDINDVISIGDSDNDKEALKISGLGIAVSNGTDTIKEIADEIACSNDEHIVKYVLEKYYK